MLIAQIFVSSGIKQSIHSRHRFCMKRLFYIILILTIQLLIFRAAFAASPSEKVPRYKKRNQQAVENLQKMTPEQLKAIDAKLSKALTYYYDRKFALALPLFREIAQMVETMDIMFWIGTSAMNLGKTELAIESFNKMLAIDPELHRVRLELAATYFSMGKFDEAKKELEVVEASSPPPEVQANIKRMLAAINDRTQKTSWNLRASAGLLFDTNINAGPGQRELEVVGGTLNLDELSSQLGDQGTLIEAFGNLNYDIGERRGLMWNTSANLFNKVYLNYSQFNFLLMDVATGPWYVRHRDIFKLPVGFTHTQYGSDRLYYAFNIFPSYEYNFSQTFGLRGSYLYRNINYFSTRNSELDNATHRIDLRPLFYLKGRRHIVSGLVGYENSDADADQWSYNTPLLGISYIGNFPSRTELYLGYQWFRREYDGTPPLYEQDREDTRSMFRVAVSQRFFKRLFWSVTFNYIDNESNADLYTFDQKAFSVNLGWLH